MPTGQQLANAIMTRLGLNSPEGVAGPSDSNTVLAALNTMWKAWGVDEGLIWGQSTYQGVLAANQASYSIGTSGDFSTTRPARIYKAFVTAVTSATGTTTSGSAVVAFASTSALIVGQQLIGAGIPANSFIRSISTNVSATIDNAATASATVTLYCTTGNRNELTIVEAGKYYSHNDLGSVAYTPDELYPDYLTSGTNGTMNLYLYPVPRAAGLALELDMAVPFTTWVLGTNYNVPDAVQDAIEWAVAFRLLPTFGIAVMPQVAQVVTLMGKESDTRLRAANSFNRQLPPQVVAAPGSQPAAGA